jgi:GNAT superfamily N-acetyltransferase
VPHIRLATRADARGVARVHVRTWQAAYRGLMSDTFLSDLSIDARAERWRNLLPDQATGFVPGAIPRCLWIAVGPGDRETGVVGFCSLGPTRDDGASEAEVYALYVDAEHWRHGVGRALLATAEAAARGASASLSLWTLRDNLRARGFYERQGYATDGGEREDEVGGARLAHVRYRKTLEPPRDG